MPEPETGLLNLGGKFPGIWIRAEDADLYLDALECGHERRISLLMDLLDSARQVMEADRDSPVAPTGAMTPPGWDYEKGETT